MASDPARDGLFPDALELTGRDARLQAMKELVADIAHSFNNSLAPLTGYVTLLADELKPGTSGAQHLAKFEGAVRKAQLTVEAIVEATHPERRCYLRSTDFKLLIERTVERWMKGLPASSQISVESRTAPCVLNLDEALWEKVLHQLLRNAELALPKGGSVEIGLAERTLSAEQAAQLGIEDTTVVELVVRDTGDGMAPDALTRACDPLFTTRSHGPTAGLGLTLAHGVARLHGGQLWIESVEEQGTTVRIWLPCS